MTERRSAVSVTRRIMLLGLGGTMLAAGTTAAYGFGIEPMRLSVTQYRITPLGPWPKDLALRIVALADIHACEPWMSPARIRGIVDTANTLGGDVIVLLGDYVAGLDKVVRHVDSAEWAPILGGLKAPLGSFAVLGNHDWWQDRAIRKRGSGPTLAGEAIKRAGIRLLENEAVPVQVRGHEVWFAGLGDQLAFQGVAKRLGLPKIGVDDLAGTMAQIPDGAPTVLLAHEPDIFPQVPPRVALTLSGHTHGGQIRLFGWAPGVPSRHGNRYGYGHVREQADLVVSGGLGMSGIPVRLGVPPEIVVVDLVGAGVS